MIFGWFILFSIVHFIDGFKIVVIGDETSIDHEIYSEYVNASITFLDTGILEFQYIQLSDDTEKAYRDVCSSLETEGASLLISVTEKANVISAVKSASYQSGIPTIQVQYGPWVDGRPSANTILENQNSTEAPSVEFRASTHSKRTDLFGVRSGVVHRNAAPPASSFVIVIPPWISILTVIHDFILRTNLTEVNVIMDQSYKRDATLTATLSNTGIRYRFFDMATNETDIEEQMQTMKKGSVRTNLFIASVANLETYFTAAKPDIESRHFNWFFFTKDPRALLCENCGALDVLSMTPLLADDTDFVKFGEFKEFIIKKWMNPDLYQGLNQIELSFFLDMTNVAWDTYTYLNMTGEMQFDYVCRNGTGISNQTTETVNEIMPTVRPLGGYGDYMRFQDFSYYQNVPMSFRRCDYSESRQCKKMGNWSVTQGIVEEYDSLLEDITNIKIYRVTTVVQPPFVQLKEGGGFEGYCIDLIDYIKDIVGFNYTIYEVKDKLYGSINDRNEWNGLIGELVSGEAEIALAPLSVMAERENYVDFTVPYYDLVGTTILMKRVQQDYSLFKFMTVLEAPVWGCIVGAYFFTSFLLWVFDRFSPYSYTNNREKYKDDPEKREFSFKECLWFCMTSLTPQGGGEAPKNISGRLVAATWWLFGFIIIASYTANLAAFLTVSRLEMPISSLDDLAKQYKIKYAPVRGTSAETYFRRMAEIEDRFYEIWKAMSLNESMTPQQRAQLAVWDYPVSDKFTNMWRYMQETGLPNSTDQAIEQVLASPSSTEGFAYIGDATEIRYAELTDCRLQRVGNEFSRKPYAIAVQQYSPLKDSISSAILKLLNQRTLETLKEKWWQRNPNRKTCPRSEDESDGISIQNIGGVFIVILVGIAVSMITLAFEYWYYKDKRVNEEGQVANGRTGHPHGGNNNNVHVKDANGVVAMGHFNSAFSARE